MRLGAEERHRERVLDQRDVQVGDHLGRGRGQTPEQVEHAGVHVGRAPAGGRHGSAGEVIKVVALVERETQRPRQRGQHLLRRLGTGALLELGVVLDRRAGKHRHLVAAQAWNAASRAGRQPHILGSDAVPARLEEATQLSKVHADQSARCPSPYPGVGNPRVSGLWSVSSPSPNLEAHRSPPNDREQNMPRIALITGGNRGLGRAIATSLADAGVDAVITYRSHADEAAEVVAALEEKGRTAIALRLDTTATGTFTTFATTLREALQQTWGRESLDILVNNAGFSGSTVLGSTDEETIDQLFAVHFKGVYLLTQALATDADGGAPLLADGGRIVNLSSGLARFVTKPYAVYASMKGAVEVLTRYWAHELGGRGITVNTIAPGPVATDFADGYVRSSEDVQKAMSDMTALGRYATAADIGPAVAALVGEGTGWITAQRIEASGGFRI